MQKKIGFQFTEAECLKIDPKGKKIYCRSKLEDGEKEFVVDYDYLVISVGASVNTFNTPGVMEHCHFLKVTSSATLYIHLLQYCKIISSKMKFLS